MANVSIKELQGAIEEQLHAKANYKSKVAVQETQKDGSLWEGDVYVFDLVYTLRPQTSKAEIAAWKLTPPTSAALDAAVQLGNKMKAEFSRPQEQRPNSLHKAKLAYAWSMAVKGSRTPKIYTLLHRGPVNSAAEAVKAAIARDL